MNPNVYEFLKQNEQLLFFVRKHPIWYRYLSRDPSRVGELVEEAKKFYGQTFQQRTERLAQQLKMVHLLLQLTKTTKDNK